MEAPWQSKAPMGGVGNEEFGLTGKSRIYKKLDSDTEIPPPLSFLSDGLFNRLQGWEECLIGHQDTEPGREICSQDEQKSMRSFRWQRRLRLQYSICSSHRIKFNNEVVLKAASLCLE